MKEPSAGLGVRIQSSENTPPFGLLKMNGIFRQLPGKIDPGEPSKKNRCESSFLCANGRFENVLKFFEISFTFKVGDFRNLA